MTVEAGLTASFTRMVSSEHTADSLKTGDVPALATPVLIAWCEEATMLALEGQLEEGLTTVGMRVRVDHLFPTPVGYEVTVTATLVRVDGRRFTFDTIVSYQGVDLTDGQVVRVLTKRDRFVERMTEAYEKGTLEPS